MAVEMKVSDLVDLENKLKAKSGDKGTLQIRGQIRFIGQDAAVEGGKEIVAIEQWQNATEKKWQITVKTDRPVGWKKKLGTPTKELGDTMCWRFDTEKGENEFKDLVTVVNSQME